MKRDGLKWVLRMCFKFIAYALLQQIGKLCASQPRNGELERRGKSLGTLHKSALWGEDFSAKCFKRSCIWHAALKRQTATNHLSETPRSDKDGPIEYFLLSASDP